MTGGVCGSVGPIYPPSLALNITQSFYSAFKLQEDDSELANQETEVHEFVDTYTEFPVEEQSVDMFLGRSCSLYETTNTQFPNCSPLVSDGPCAEQRVACGVIGVFNPEK